MINIGKVGVDKIIVRCHIKNNGRSFDLILTPSYDTETESICLTDQNGNKVLSDLSQLQEFVDKLTLNGSK